MPENPFRNLPAVNDILDLPAIRVLDHDHGRDRVVAAIRQELAELRQQLGRGLQVDGQSDPQTLAARVAARLHRDFQPKLRPVINATGIILHTNLGRAPIAESAAKAAYEAARGYLNLELDLQ